MIILYCNNAGQTVHKHEKMIKVKKKVMQLITKKIPLDVTSVVHILNSLQSIKCLKC
jgi:hypothetical protein